MMTCVGVVLLKIRREEEATHPFCAEEEEERVEE